jgi:hypothetical protein
VMAPFFFRRWFGRTPAIVLAFALAFDPGLVALSRQAGGPALAAGFILLALGGWLSGYPVLAGIFSGLALLSGMGLWPGLAALVLAGFLYRLALRDQGDAGLPEIKMPVWNAVFAGVAVLLLVGTLFFQVPRGLSAIGGSLAAYLSGWSAPTTSPLLVWLITLLFYQPIALILGIAGVSRALRRSPIQALRVDGFLSLWFVLALLIGAVYPARQPGDLVWVIIPLWALAVREGLRYLDLEPAARLAALGLGLLTVVLLIFFCLNMAGVVSALSLNLQNQTFPQYWAAMAASIGLVVLMAYLVAWGWSIQAAGRGLLGGLLVVLAVGTLSSSTSAAGWRVLQNAELWQVSPSMPDVRLLASTTADLSRWNTGAPNTLDVLSVGADRPSLDWTFREVPGYRQIPKLPGGVNASFVITTADQQPLLASTYRGQKIQVSSAPNWDKMAILDWLDWMIYRKTSSEGQTLILWARADLFAGGAASSGIKSAPRST